MSEINNGEVKETSSPEEKRGLEIEDTKETENSEKEDDGLEVEEDTDTENPKDENGLEVDDVEETLEDENSSEFEIGGHQNMEAKEVEQYKQDGNKEFADLQGKSEGEMTDADKQDFVDAQDKFERQVMGEENTRDILSDSSENKEDTDNNSDDDEKRPPIHAIGDDKSYI